MQGTFFPSGSILGPQCLGLQCLGLQCLRRGTESRPAQQIVQPMLLQPAADDQHLSRTHDCCFHNADPDTTVHMSCQIQKCRF